MTAVALIALTLGLGVIPAVLGDLDGATLGATYTVRPAHRPDGLEAPGVLDEGLEVDHRRASLGPERSVVVIRIEGRVYPPDDATGTTTLESRMSLPKLLSPRGIAKRGPRVQFPPLAPSWLHSALA